MNALTKLYEEYIEHLEYILGLVVSSDINIDKYENGDTITHNEYRDKIELMKLKMKDVEERRKLFWKEVLEYRRKYPENMLRDFFLYWSEKDKKGTKMKYELQKTWELGLRIAKWNNNSYGSKNTAKTQSDPKYKKYGGW